MAHDDRPDHCWVWKHDLWKKQKERLAKASWQASWSSKQQSASWRVKKNHGKNARSNAWKYSL